MSLQIYLKEMHDIKEFIFSHFIPKKLLPWIPKDCLDFKGLSSNPNAINILSSNSDKIHLNHLTCNTNASKLLKQHFPKINRIHFIDLCANPAAYTIIMDNFDNIDWYMLHTNPHPSLTQTIINDINPEEFNIESMDEYTLTALEFISQNNNPIYIPFIEKFVECFHKLDNSFFNDDDDESSDKVIIFLQNLSKNPNAIPILKKYPRFIYYPNLCKNTNPAVYNIIIRAIDTNIPKYFLREGIDNYINYKAISKNPAMIEFIIKNQYLIHFFKLCENPNAIPLINSMYNSNIHYKKKIVTHLVKNPSLDRLSEHIKTQIIHQSYKDKDIRFKLSKNPYIFKTVKDWDSITSFILNIIFE